MLESQREILLKLNKGYLSIGITEDGDFMRVIPVPWQQTGNAFNMKRPKIYITPEDLDDPELMAELEGYGVQGLYIFAPLTDYSFIARFPGLWDIYICGCGSFIDLSFMKKLPDWSMFFLRDAVTADISPLFPQDPRSRMKHHRICLTNYFLADSPLDGEQGVISSELLIE